jgi:ribosomal protein L30E
MKKNVLFMLTILLVFFFSNPLGATDKIGKNKILDAGEEWHQEYLNYRVDESFIDTLKSKIGKNLKIDVYLGLWCKDSKVNVPKFIKLVDTINNKNLIVNYYNCPRKANRQVKYYVEKFKVERIPTFIFYRNGKELGRIIEHPQKSIADDFLNIL